MSNQQAVANSDLMQKRFAVFFEEVEWLGMEVLYLWVDAISFFSDAQKTRSRGALSSAKKERLYRASVLSAAAAFEGLTNFLADRLLKHGKGLNPGEADCLSERRWSLNSGKAIEQKQRFGSIERFQLVFRIVTGGQELSNEMRNEIKSAFAVRDHLVHPKPGVTVSLSKDDEGFRALWGLIKAALIISHALRQRTDLKTAA